MASPWMLKTAQKCESCVALKRSVNLHEVVEIHLC